MIISSEYVLQKKFDMDDNSSSGSRVEESFFSPVKKMSQLTDNRGRRHSPVGCF